MTSFICSSKYSSSILRGAETQSRTQQVSLRPVVTGRDSVRPRRSPVRLVQDQDLDVGQLEGRRVVQVIDQTAGRRYQHVRTGPQRSLLRLQVQPTCTHNGTGYLGTGVPLSPARRGTFV